MSGVGKKKRVAKTKLSTKHVERTGPYTEKAHEAWTGSVKDKEAYMQLRAKGKSKAAAAAISNHHSRKRVNKEIDKKYGKK